MVGDALFPVALAFAVLDELNGTPAQLGLVLAAQTLPLAVLILAAGVWADRLNRRNVMVVSDLGRAARPGRARGAAAHGQRASCGTSSCWWRSTARSRPASGPPPAG